MQNEFDTLKELYETHLNSFEQAIMIRKDLEARIRMLEKLEGDNITLIKAEHSRREQDYLDIVRLMQEDYEKFRNDNAKEFELRD